MFAADDTDAKAVRAAEGAAAVPCSLSLQEASNLDTVLSITLPTVASSINNNKNDERLQYACRLCRFELNYSSYRRPVFHLARAFTCVAPLLSVHNLVMPALRADAFISGGRHAHQEPSLKKTSRKYG